MGYLDGGCTLLYSIMHSNWRGGGGHKVTRVAYG